MPFRLSETTIRQRFVEWRNLKQLHAAQKRRNQQLEAHNHQLTRRIQQLELQLAQRDRYIEKLELRIGDLEKMVFGEKKKDKDSSSSQSSSNNTDQNNNRQPRSRDSYQRSQPQDKDITATKHPPIAACRHCGGPLSRFEEVVRYVEDIILPQLLGKLTRTVTKHVIERGYCGNCGVWSAAQDLRGQLVALGRNVKLLVFTSPPSSTAPTSK